MKINYNVTGAQRKSLVAAINQELNAPSKYLGMPTAAYEVGEYRIEKDGTVTGPDNYGLVADLQGLHDFKAVSEEYDTPLPKSPETPAFESLQLTEREELGLRRERRDPAGEDGMQASDVLDDEDYPDIDQHHPGQYANLDIPVTEEMLRQAEQWMQCQPEFENRTYRAELSDPETPDRMEVFSADNDEDAVRQAYEYTDGEVKLLELFELDTDYNEIRSVDIPPKSTHLTIEYPLAGFTTEKLDNLAKLVTAKATLLKAALATDELPIKQTADTLQFPWFWEEKVLTSEEVEAYSTLVSLLCKTAKEKKRITAKEKTVEGNPKYAMRCFLLSLGFIGDEYKVSRRILLSRLEGNSSWKNGKKAEVEGDE